jgi:hypothetical protein
MMYQYDEALICYEQASRLAPGEVRHWRNRSALLGLLGRHDEALTAANEGLRLDPTDRNLQENRAAAQQAMGKPDLSALRAKAAIRTAAEPEKQGMASGLLNGAMRDDTVNDVASLVLSLIERDVPNMAALYELARESHRRMPSFDALMDMIEDGELVVVRRGAARADQRQPTPHQSSGDSSGAGATSRGSDAEPPTVTGAQDRTPSASETFSGGDKRRAWTMIVGPAPSQQTQRANTGPGDMSSLTLPTAQAAAVREAAQRAENALRSRAPKQPEPMEIDEATHMLADLSSDSIALSLRSFLERLGLEDQSAWKPDLIGEVSIDIMASAMLFAMIASRDLWGVEAFESILASFRRGLERTISDAKVEGLSSEDLTVRHRQLMLMVNESGKLGHDLIYDEQIPGQVAERTATWTTRAFPPEISDAQRRRFWLRLAILAYGEMLATAVIWRQMCAENDFYVDDESDVE